MGEFMTRETKIGLLVGLAFIIVIGILLSDHLSSANDPPQAALGGAGDNVREGVTTPGGAGPSAGPGFGADGLPRVTAAGGGAAHAPSRTVNTRTDLAAQARRPSVGIVQVGPGSGDWPPVSAEHRRTIPPGTPGAPGAAAMYPQDPEVTPQAPAAGPPVYVEPPPQPPVAIEPARITAPRPGDAVTAPPVTAPRGLHELADRHPGDFVHVDQYGQPIPSQVVRPRDTAPAPPVAPPRQYTAQSGDSVSRMASRLLGANTKANRDLIIRANPSLQAEGNVVVAGRSYTIPNAGPAPAPGVPPAARPPARQAASETAAPGASFTWYTVRENDNLTKIAAEHLGNGNAWTSLLEHNRDILKDGNKLKANMKIRIPAPPVASTAN